LIHIPPFDQLNRFLSKVRCIDQSFSQNADSRSPIPTLGIDNDLSVTWTKLRLILAQNEYSNLASYLKLVEAPERRPHLLDFISRHEFVRWNSVFMSRFAAFFLVKLALWANERQFDRLADTASVRLVVTRLADRPPRRNSAGTAWWRTQFPLASAIKPRERISDGDEVFERESS
jgi:hypothetical protein